MISFVTLEKMEMFHILVLVFIAKEDGEIKPLKN